MRWSLIMRVNLSHKRWKPLLCRLRMPFQRLAPSLVVRRLICISSAWRPWRVLQIRSPGWKNPLRSRRVARCVSLLNPKRSMNLRQAGWPAILRIKSRRAWSIRGRSGYVLCVRRVLLISLDEAGRERQRRVTLSARSDCGTTECPPDTRAWTLRACRGHGSNATLALRSIAEGACPGTQLLVEPSIRNGYKRYKKDDVFMTTIHHEFITTGTRGLRHDILPMRLYHKAKRLGVWDPRSIDFSQD